MSSPTRLWAVDEAKSTHHALTWEAQPKLGLLVVAEIRSFGLGGFLKFRVEDSGNLLSFYELSLETYLVVKCVRSRAAVFFLDLKNRRPMPVSILWGNWNIFKITKAETHAERVKKTESKNQKTKQTDNRGLVVKHVMYLYVSRRMTPLCGVRCH